MGTIFEGTQNDADSGDTNSNPRKRRRVQFSGSNYGDELYPLPQKPNRLMRWHYFMAFNTKSIHEVIIEAIISRPEHSIARQRALEWTESWKSKTLQLMLVCYSISFFLRSCTNWSSNTFERKRPRQGIDVDNIRVQANFYS